MAIKIEAAQRLHAGETIHQKLEKLAKKHGFEYDEIDDLACIILPATKFVPHPGEEAEGNPVLMTEDGVEWAIDMEDNHNPFWTHPGVPASRLLNEISRMEKVLKFDATEFRKIATEVLKLKD